MKVFSIICHNGLGHFKRSITMLNLLQKQLQGVQITVACEQWQIDRMQDWEIAAEFFRDSNCSVKVLPNLIAPGIYWDMNPENYEDDRLINWHTRLANIEELENADLVLSDNLSQVLHYRNDAILVGSFLWSDVLEDAFATNAKVKAFVAEERELLAKHKPPMLCVGDIVMPGVISQTTAVPLPWFCQDNPFVNAPIVSKIESKSRYRVALLGGATDAIANQLTILASLLAQTGNIEVLLPKQLLREVGEIENVSLFDHSSACFASLDLIVCRPGVGTLTDGICYGVPIASVYEEGNIEMTHNGQVIDNLNIGINLGEIISVTETSCKILQFLDSSTYFITKEGIQKRPKEGVSASVSWLLERLKQSNNNG